MIKNLLKDYSFSQLTSLLNEDSLRELRELSPFKRPQTLAQLGIPSEHIPFISTLIDLQAQAQSKLGVVFPLLLDRLALEQCSADWISIYKNELIPAGSRVVDLCCGMGGDSIHLKKAHSILGIDLSEDRLAMFQYNLRHHSNAFAIRSDATLPAIRGKADILFCDPDRRSADRQRNWNPADLCPNFDQLDLWLKHFDGALLKLSPSLDWKSMKVEGDIDFLGGPRDCREALIRRGSMAAETPTLRAYINGVGNMAAPWQEVLEALPEINPIPAKFLIEPAKVLIRSGLNRWYANQNSLPVLHNDIAYINSETPIANPMFHNYPIITWGTGNDKKIKRAIAEYNLNIVEIKKRGSDKDPAAELKKFKKANKDKGGRSAYLFFTQSSEGHLFILTEPPLKNL